MQTPPMKICPDCGQAAIPNATHCLRCGRSLPMTPLQPLDMPSGGPVSMNFPGYEMPPAATSGAPGMPPSVPYPNGPMGQAGPGSTFSGMPPTNDAPGSPNMLGALRGSNPSDNMFSGIANMPPPGPGAPPPWQQPSSMPPNPPPVGDAQNWQPPLQPNSAPPPWQQGMPAQPGNPPPWQQGTQAPPPWEGGPPVQQTPPWQQGMPVQPANRMTSWNQAPVPGSGAPRAVQGNRTTIALAAIFLGALGVHKFMLGMKTPGLILLCSTLLTFGTGVMVTGLIGIVEGIIYLSKSDADFEATYVCGNKEWF